jgi:spore coat polysaccharide biosynthesis predicted glycosyltransferase SpsG/RimJ/RimL family protein N-acetyltransferase
VIAFRCDGDARLGAGHVARCAQLARAFEAGGSEVVMVGRYEGVAAQLVGELATASDLPAEAEAVIVDSYEIPPHEINVIARRLPVAVVEDGAAAPAVTAVLAYHLDATERTAIPPGTVAVLGPDHAPIRPGCIRARRARGLRLGLVTVGGGTAGEHLVDDAAGALRGIAEQVRVAGPGGAAVSPDEMLDLIAEADVAVSAAGSTPYELACAGVPAVLVAVADNQLPVVREFGRAGIAIGLEDPSGLADAAARLGDPALRERLAAAGPAIVDGYGAFRAREALLAAFAGRPLPVPLRYRPAAVSDSALLLAWRNDPDVREASRSMDPVAPEEHKRWLAGVLADPQRTLLVVEVGGEPAGTVRFDRRDDDAEISVAVAPGRRHRGIGSRAIREAAELELAARPSLRRILVEVQERNDRSLRTFEGAGYRRLPERPHEGSLLLALDRTDLRGRLH